MKVKNLNREQTIALIDEFKKRINFNNELNSFVRKYMKKNDPQNSFNGFHDAPTADMLNNLQELLNAQTWMSDELKTTYMRSCGEVFGQIYGPHVNRYVLGDLHDLEKHLEEIERAAETRREENDYFKVERDLGKNRLNLYFEDVPEVEMRNLLKRNGFRWSPYLCAWTRQLTQEAEKSLERIKSTLNIQ